MLAADVGREERGAYRKPADMLARQEVLRRRVFVAGMVKTDGEYGGEIGGDNEGVHSKDAQYNAAGGRWRTANESAW